MNIKLLDKFDANAIREVTAARSKYTMHNGDVRLPQFVAYQGDGTVKKATGRATCRLCGTKIKDGMQLTFCYDEEQNSWTAKDYSVHADGCPLTWAARNELTKAALAKVNDKHLNAEVEHFLGVDDDEDRPHDYYDAVESAESLAQDVGDRKVLTPARRVLIELGVYIVVTREYLDGFTTLSSRGQGRGIAPDFKLGGLLYLFEKHVNVTDPESADGANNE